MQRHQISWEEMKTKRRKLWTLPTVYGPNAFTRRPLEISEAVSCCDVPATLAKGWNEPTKEVLVRELSTPIKAAAALGSCLAEWTRHTCAKLTEPEPSRDTPMTTDNGQKNDKDELNNKKRPHTMMDNQEETGTTKGNSAFERMKDYQRGKDATVDTNTEKAVKHDKAAVPVELWDDRVRYLLGYNSLDDRHRHAFEMLRTVMLIRWKRNVRRSWFDWWVKNERII